MGEVYSIGIDLSQLQKALQMSLQIKNNLASLGGNSSKGQSGGNSHLHSSMDRLETFALQMYAEMQARFTFQYG